MKEVPMPYVKAHQWGIVLLFLSALIFQQPVILYVLAIIHMLTLLIGSKGSLFIQLVKPFLKNRIANAETQSRELSFFNHSLGMAFIMLSIICFALNWSVAGYIFAAMFALAAFIAICGFCMGCFIYYQIKRLNH